MPSETISPQDAIADLQKETKRVIDSSYDIGKIQGMTDALGILVNNIGLPGLDVAELILARIKELA